MNWEGAWWARECLTAPDGIHEPDDRGHCVHCQAHCGDYRRGYPEDHDPTKIETDPDDDDGRQIWYPGFVVDDREDRK